MERGNFHINLSIDSLDPATYSAIRVNGNLDDVLKNFEYFKSYCRKRDRDLCIMVNPMRQNWKGLGDFVNFCDKHRVSLWFNTIIRPYDQALWNLPARELADIHQYLASVKFKKFNLISIRRSIHNNRIFENLVNTQIWNWHQEALQRESLLSAAGAEGSDPRNQYETNLETFIRIQFRENPPEAMAVRELVREKTAHMIRHLHDRMDENTFYTLLNNRSPAATFIFLLEQPDDVIIRDLEQFIQLNQVQE
jgi:hypothetical protein